MDRHSRGEVIQDHGQRHISVLALGLSVPWRETQLTGCIQRQDHGQRRRALSVLSVQDHGFRHSLILGLGLSAPWRETQVAPGPQIEAHASVCCVCSAPRTETRFSLRTRFFSTVERDRVGRSRALQNHGQRCVAFSIVKCSTDKWKWNIFWMFQGLGHFV